MRKLGLATAMAILLTSSHERAQQRSVAPAQPQAQSQVQTQIQTQATVESGPTKETSRTAKQKLLDDQAQRLVTMANELKSAVDKTNKNILSLDVVRKAEEIESLAHKMKDQGKR
jgi:hypothetical protein